MTNEIVPLPEYTGERMEEIPKKLSLEQEVAALTRRVSDAESKLRYANEWAEMFNKRMTIIESLCKAIQQGLLTTDELKLLRNLLKEIKEND